MAGAITRHSAAATADEQIYTGAATLWGFNVSATDASEIFIRDGTAATDPIVAHIKLGINGWANQNLAPIGIRINNGIYIDRVSGTTAVTVYCG